MQDTQSVIQLEIGEIWATGKNSYGNLSIGDTTQPNTFVRMKENDESYLTDVLRLSYGISDRNNVVIKNDGTVWVSGTNKYGAYGNKTYTTTEGYYFTKAGTVTVDLNIKNEGFENIIVRFYKILKI